MKLVRSHTHWQHDSALAPGEPLSLHFTLRADLERMEEGAASDAIRAALLRTNTLLSQSARENGKPMRAYLNAVAETQEDQNILNLFARFRGRSDAAILLNLAVHDELRRRKVLP